MNNDGTLLEVKDLVKWFSKKRGTFFKKTVQHVKAVDGVSFVLRRGETLGVVGESGCGKTTLGRLIARLLDLDSGTMFFDSNALNRKVDLTALNGDDLKQVRNDIQMIFQDPFSSLNPRMTVYETLEEPFIIHGMGTKSERSDRIAYLMRAVGLRPEYASRYPHEFSGGQRQRIGIARALALSPSLLIADEPVSALDVSVRGQVLNLLTILKKSFDFTFLFITHDLSVIEYISDRIIVMYLGKIVEIGTADQLYATPKHPYTEALLSAIPIANPDITVNRITLKGSVPSSFDPPSGCRFHTRCQYAKEICSKEEPVLQEVGPEHQVSCHFASELKLQGVVISRDDQISLKEQQLDIY